MQAEVLQPSPNFAVEQTIRIIIKYIELFPYLLVGNGSNFNVFTVPTKTIKTGRGKKSKILYIYFNLVIAMFSALTEPLCPGDTSTALLPLDTGQFQHKFSKDLLSTLP